MFQFHTGSITADIRFLRICKSILVSIPHWFDYSTFRGSCHINRILFQFHTGSITAPRTVAVNELQRRFNSTLVRLQRERYQPVTYICPVSIPHWFDYSWWRQTSVLLYFQVSIPHWFDYSNANGDGTSFDSLCFNSTLVRLQLVLEFISMILTPCFNSTLVRLQL